MHPLQDGRWTRLLLPQTSISPAFSRNPGFLPRTKRDIPSGFLRILAAKDKSQPEAASVKWEVLVWGTKTEQVPVGDPFIFRGGGRPYAPLTHNPEEELR